jgi:hypothetical protein
MALIPLPTTTFISVQHSNSSCSIPIMCKRTILHCPNCGTETVTFPQVFCHLEVLAREIVQGEIDDVGQRKLWGELDATLNQGNLDAAASLTGQCLFMAAKRFVIERKCNSSKTEEIIQWLARL